MYESILIDPFSEIKHSNFIYIFIKANLSRIYLMNIIGGENEQRNSRLITVITSIDSGQCVEFRTKMSCLTMNHFREVNSYLIRWIFALNFQHRLTDFVLFDVFLKNGNDNK